jgi:hypothetical protein
MKIQKRSESLAEVAAESDSEEAFGRNLADFEHELVWLTSRKGLLASIQARPPLSAEGFQLVASRMPGWRPMPKSWPTALTWTNSYETAS